MTPCIYIAGPMSGGNVVVNVRTALDMGEYLRKAGFAVYVPHLAWFWPHHVSYEEWIAHDLTWLARCDALLRLPGASPGADRETAYAAQHGIPIFTGVAEALRWKAARAALDG
jgi:Domain of unknown function (DUF4406)